jgi:serine/threonine protein kinase/tetratricopeptide (TPR) repeat protein
MAGTKPDEATLFDAARRIDDPAARRLYIWEACGEDLALAGRVEALLRVYDQDPTFLASPPEERLHVAPSAEGPGTLIGPYRLLRPIGEGGMGTVFLAEQTEPLRRQVAVKVIRPGMNSREVLARFEAERQSLALMDHPNIARVLDAGATPAGLPYFVMELIDGVPITKHCDGARLFVRRRLELFVAVCQAVQHAHQKGIIHRDIKPSNVLVTLYDGKAVPKVIDFGVAKATGPKLTEPTLETQIGSVIGTLEYMSPEQAVPGQLNVDTRSDVYSLGVLLYELLTGTTPLGPARSEGADLLDLLQAIRDSEPPPPSTRLAQLRIADCGLRIPGNNPQSAIRNLQWQELDWIVMKCLEKDRDRRYESASALAQDIENYLNDEPVAACPPSRAYGLRKFVRRHRGAVLAASSMALLLVLGIIGTTIGLVRAERARQDAETARQHERTQRQFAETRRAETEAVLDFVEKHVFAVARPTGRGGLGPKVTMQKAVAQALPFIGRSFKDQPLIEARLRMTMGYAFYHLGNGRLAVEQFAAARAIYTAQQGPDGADTLRSVLGLSDGYEMLGKDKEALALRQEVLARRRAVLGHDHPDTLRCMMSVANSLRKLGEFEQSVKLHEETLALRKVKLDVKDPETLRSMNNLASSLYEAGRHKEALALREETLALRREVLSNKHPDTLLSMMALANSYYRFGRYTDAVALYEETLKEQEAQLTRQHPDTLRTIHNLANGYDALGQHEKALALRQQTLKTLMRTLGEEHNQTLSAMTNLALSGPFRK